MGLSQRETKEFKQVLEQRDAELRKSIHEKLINSEDKNYSELAGRVLDVGEGAMVDLLGDLSITGLEKDTEALADVQDALSRIADGTYGECLDCGGEIAIERLRAYPTAKRCTECQKRYENLAKDRTPSL